MWEWLPRDANHPGGTHAGRKEQVSHQCPLRVDGLLPPLTAPFVGKAYSIIFSLAAEPFS